MNLIDGLSSNTTGVSVVEFSLNPAFERGYSALFKGIANYSKGKNNGRIKQICSPEDSPSEVSKPPQMPADQQLLESSIVADQHDKGQHSQQGSSAARQHKAAKEAKQSLKEATKKPEQPPQAWLKEAIKEQEEEPQASFKEAIKKPEERQQALEEQAPQGQGEVEPAPQESASAEKEKALRGRGEITFHFQTIMMYLYSPKISA